MGPSASVAALVWRKEKGSTTSAFTTSRKRSHDNSVSSVSTEGDGDDGAADQEPTHFWRYAPIISRSRRSCAVIVWMWNRDGCKEGGRGEMRQKEPQDATDDMHVQFHLVSRHLRVVSLSEKSVTLSHYYVEHLRNLLPFYTYNH